MQIYVDMDSAAELAVERDTERSAISARGHDKT